MFCRDQNFVLRGDAAHFALQPNEPACEPFDKPAIGPAAKVRVFARNDRRNCKHNAPRSSATYMMTDENQGSNPLDSVAQIVPLGCGGQLGVWQQKHDRRENGDDQRPKPVPTLKAETC